ncbi:DUF7477 domain-containing protein [Flagellimonas nanhaiensis]|uniref:DUF7477 domain-containing protein n=1 Tax=Flagellimonas nanhaiensis TaxID=2292706 RepID=A0A371JT81_9FLAO|nr:hypothetical protein [Allomuricauda nanhaiensis]RDY61033.1 hypothetical protein DX873_02320 [Allomuricauda nanhaiensis]
MKKHLITLTFLLLFVRLHSQTYFETSWISNNVKYTGFVLFYSDEEALVRIKYNANGVDKVASYKCSYQDFTKMDGTKDRYLNGTEASIVKGSTDYGYSADNFYFKNLDGGNYQAYTVDDNGLKGSDITQYMNPTLYWIKLDPKVLTSVYLDDYFNSDEPLYRLLSFENTGEMDFYTQNAAITSLAYGRDTDSSSTSIWSVVMSGFKENGYNHQKVKESSSYPSKWIETQWDLGYHITSLEYDTSRNFFVLIMSKPSNLGSQSWKRLDTFPKQWVSEKWDNNFYITSMTYGAGQWYVVMNQNTGYSAQRWKTSSSGIPKEWIKESWDSGYKITSATYGNGLWAVTMTTNSKLGTQSWKTQSDYPIDWIREKAENGYHITTIAHGDGMWFVAMSNGTPYSTNMSTSNYEFLPLNWIMQKSSN